VVLVSVSVLVLPVPVLVLVLVLRAMVLALVLVLPLLVLTTGTSLNASDTDGVTALYVAAQNGHTEVVKLLVDHKAEAGPNGTKILAIRTRRHQGEMP